MVSPDPATSWSFRRSPVEGSDFIVHMSYPLATATDPVLTRKAARLMLARSFGLMHSTRPGSGLRSDPADSIDGLSEQDVEALKIFSGCTG